jgi:hypothetical protein
MKTKLRDQEKNEAVAHARQAVKDAARILGRLGGMAGTGDAKRRPSEVCRAAVNKRWEAYRQEAKKEIVSIASRTKKRSD